jgi:thiol-disulfide isomerase/thioredoxin
MGSVERGPAAARRPATLLAGALAAAIAIGAGIGWRLWQERREDSDRAAAAAVYAIRLPDSDDQARDLAAYRGRVLVVNFWATWCGPCRDEMPDLQKIEDEYGPRGVEIVGIAIDRADAVRDFRRSTAIRYPLLVADLGGAELARQLGDADGALPYTAVLGRSGTIVERHLGAVDPTTLRHWIEAQLQS